MAKRQAVVIRLNDGEVVAVISVPGGVLAKKDIERFDNMVGYLDLQWSTHELEEAMSLEEVARHLYEDHGEEVFDKKFPDFDAIANHISEQRKKES
jgi:hypothetical protein